MLKAVLWIWNDFLNPDPALPLVMYVYADPDLELAWF
jgi:hypothetical protein